MQPIDLPKTFRVDGLEVRVSLREAADGLGPCQLGPYKQIEKIEKRLVLVIQPPR